MTRQS